MTSLQQKLKIRSDFKDVQGERLNQVHDISIALGASLRDAREKAGVSLEDASVFVGLSESGLERIESKANGVTVTMLYLFSELYNVPVAKLLPSLGKL